MAQALRNSASSESSRACNASAVDDCGLAGFSPCWSFMISRTSRHDCAAPCCYCSCQSGSDDGDINPFFSILVRKRFQHYAALLCCRTASRYGTRATKNTTHKSIVICTHTHTEERIGLRALVTINRAGRGRTHSVSDVVLLFCLYLHSSYSTAYHEGEI